MKDKSRKVTDAREVGLQVEEGLGCMKSAGKSILTANAGSLSIKFAIFEPDWLLRMKLAGRIERMGMSGTAFSVQGADWGEIFTRPVATGDLTAAVAVLVDWIEDSATRSGNGSALSRLRWVFWVLNSTICEMRGMRTLSRQTPPVS